LRHERAIEEFLKTIEPKYNAAVRNLANEQIDAETIYVIAGFAAYVMCCSSAGMRIQSEPLKDAVEAPAAAMDAQGLIPALPRELGGESLTELLKSGAVKVNVDPKYPQAIGISSILEFVRLFGNFRWDTLHNGSTKTRFSRVTFPPPSRRPGTPSYLIGSSLLRQILQFGSDRTRPSTKAARAFRSRISHVGQETSVTRRLRASIA
jgi:hypothetical protein